MKTEKFKIFFNDGKQGEIVIESRKLTPENKNEFNIISLKKGGSTLYENEKGVYMYGNHTLIELRNVPNKPKLKIAGNRRLIDFLVWILSPAYQPRLDWVNEYGWSEE